MCIRTNGGGRKPGAKHLDKPKAQKTASVTDVANDLVQRKVSESVTGEATQKQKTQDQREQTQHKTTD